MTISITALRALLAAGTPGPWEYGALAYSGRYLRDGRGYVFANVDDDGNGALITAAVNALPELLDEVERLQRLALEACEVALHSSPTVEDRRRVETIRKVAR